MRIHDLRLDGWRHIASMNLDARAAIESGISKAMDSDPVYKGRKKSRNISNFPGIKVSHEGNYEDLAIWDRMGSPPVLFAVENFLQPGSAELKALIEINEELKSARERIVAKNMGLIRHATFRYRGTFRHIDDDDLINMGAIGCCAAIDRFDPEHEVQFSTFAVTGIRNAASRYAKDIGHLIRIPVHIQDNITKFYSAPESVSKSDGIRIEEVLRANNPAPLDASLGSKKGGSDHRTLHDVLSIEDGSHDIVEAMTEESLRKRIELISSSMLSDSEKFIVFNYFGLKTGEPKTLNDIGDDLALSRERVRQLKNRAMEKLRNSPELNDLMDILLA